MWKIAIAVMLLATSAFGALNMTVAPDSQSPDAANKVTFTFHMTNPDGLAITGYTIVPVAVSPGTALTALKYSARSDLSGGVLSDPTTTAVTNKLLSQITDLGYTSPDVINQNLAGGDITAGGTTPITDTGLVSWTFVLASPPLAQPLQIKFNMSTTVWGGQETPDGFAILGDGPAFSQTVTITPEPASMLLLAVGAAFFARRRRA